MAVAHGEGCYLADDAEPHAVAANGHGLVRHGQDHRAPALAADDPANPNGSLRGIAGVANAAGNVAGLMPHPETAVEAILGSDDGLAIIRSFVESAAARAAAPRREHDLVAATR